MITEPVASNSGSTQLTIRVAIWGCIIAAVILVTFGGVQWWWGLQVLHGTPVGQTTSQMAVTNQTVVSPQLNDLGNYGSYLQGTVASLWALAGVFIIFVAFLVQAQQLNDQRKQFTAQSASIRRQDFEAFFFQLLSLHNEIVAGTRQRWLGTGGEVKSEVSGRGCFQRWYDSFSSPSFPPEKTSIERYQWLHDRHQGELGHYFRNLYHVIKFVKNSEVEDKRRYTSLVRATLSQFELVLLFYNCASPLGDKFKPLVEEFGLLENLNRKLLLKAEDEKLYDPKAFQ